MNLMSSPSSSSAPASSRLPWADYVPKPGHFDEFRAADGDIRPLWQQWLPLLGPEPGTALRAADDAGRRAVIEQDVSMNVYADGKSGARPWPLDAVPMLLGAEDWATITAGLRQRARLFNALLQDLYGPQRLLKSAVLPATLAMANPHFLRACAGLGKSRQRFLHTYAADVARSPDGRWWVIEDRLDAPSGLGYTLQNRVIVRQVLPEIFHRAPVQRLHRFFSGFRASLEELGARGEQTSIVLLTPGPANETYFEQAHLARYLGYTLVEGEDLTTRKGEVYLRTVGGLRNVDVIVRRVDSDFCDPLELNESSVLGVPGLVQAARHGRVVLANQIGARALESTALLAFLPALSRSLLGEELLLPSVATWWCGQVEAQRYVLENLPNLVVKPTFPTPAGISSRYGALLDDAGRAALATEIRAKPWGWCGQERVFLGTTPGWDAASETLRPMPFVTRVYLAAHGDDYHVLPGGLTRCNPAGEDAIVSLQAGSVTKDTWILDATSPESRAPLLTAAGASPVRLAHGMPSRVADNLFWLGRYLERTEHLARLLERLEPLLRDEIAVLDPGVAEDAVRLVFALQDHIAPTNGTAGTILAAARDLAADAAQPGSLAANLVRFTRVLDAVRVRLPREASLIARQLDRVAREGAASWQDLRRQLAALSGVLSETLPRDAGWRFLDLGRRLERGCQVLHVLRHFLGAAGGLTPTEFRLQVALEMADCLFAFRSVYHGAFHPAPVLAWLVNDAENARSLRFQAECIGRELAELPDEPAPAAVAALRDRAFYLLGRVRLANLPVLATNAGQAADLWYELLAVHGELGDRIGRVYFAHSEGSNGQ